MVVGGVLAGVGAMAMYFGLLAGADPTVPQHAYTAVGVGAVAAAIGTVVMIASAGTGVRQTDPSKRKDAYVREPLWLTPRVAMRRPTTLQILSRQF